MVVVFMLPIYRMINLLVDERDNKSKDLARSSGVHEASYWLSWFIYFLIGVSFVAMAMALVLTNYVYNYSEVIPVFLVFFLYGISLFGYCVIIQAFFTKSTLASIVGSLIFFATSFVDQII